MTSDSPNKYHGIYQLPKIIQQEYKDIVALKTVGAYSIIEATSITTSKKYLIKSVFLPHLTDNSLVTRLKYETELLYLLNHPGIIGEINSGEDNQFYFVVLEYFTAKTLRSLLHSETLSGFQKKQIANSLIQIVSFIHEKGIIHRNITPENILVSENIEVKLTGFSKDSYAKERNLEEKFSLYRNTKTYSNHSISGEEISKDSDLFSLGLTMLELFAGKSNFKQIASNENISKINVNLSVNGVEELI